MLSEWPVCPFKMATPVPEYTYPFSRFSTHHRQAAVFNFSDYRGRLPQFSDGAWSHQVHTLSALGHSHGIHWLSLHQVYIPGTVKVGDEAEKDG